MSSSAVHLFGVRHHGPGCARSLRRALEELRPDCVLIEGPPEADALLNFALAEDMQPPVALLIYAPEEPKRAAFYPFAEFSPEWQAIRYALEKSVPVRFMDLPQTHSLALEKAREIPENPDTPPSVETAPENADGAEVSEETAEEEPAETETLNLRRDPLGWLGQAAGYGGGEEWWEHMVEQRQDGAELFTAIAEAMTAVRAESPPPVCEAEAKRELLREAHMRKTIRAAQKEGRERIAVVCGAWHVPALAAMPSAAADNELLKGLPKLKTDATWIPWTYDRLSAESGYGAGVDSPAWYEFLWKQNGAVNAAVWFARVARLLREADLDCSSAHIIECVRLTEALAAVRERPLPGLAEMMEAARAVLTTGEDAPLKLIRRELIIGHRLGQVTADVPVVPLQRDLEKLQKSLRFKVTATAEPLELDLRKENDLARSRLLYRLQLLKLPWGKVLHARGGKGTFRESWQIQWLPEFALTIIEASPFGNTVEEASAAASVEAARKAVDLKSLTELVSRLLLADLPRALESVMRELENRAAQTGDLSQLMNAVPPLARVSRYGDVRQTEVSQVLHVLDGLVTRICIGLAAACQSLDDDAAEAMEKSIRELHAALKLLERPEHFAAWLPALAHLADARGVHERLHGAATRILLDENHTPPEDAAARMSRALSRGAAPEHAAAWLEGFLGGSGMVMVHDPALLRLVDEWVCQLSGEHFTQILPLIRRTFSAFPPMERRQIGEQVRRETSGGKTASTTATSVGPAEAWDESRAEAMLPVLRVILGR